MGVLVHDEAPRGGSRPRDPPRASVLQLGLLALAIAAATYARSVISPLQEAMRTGLALTDNQMALLQGLALAAPMTLGAAPFGFVVDRFGRAFLFAPLMLGLFAATVLTAFGTGFRELLVARMIVGASIGAVLIAAYSLMADLVPERLRGRAGTALAFGEIVGAPLAYAAGGLLLAGLARRPLDWRAASLWMSAPLLVLSGLMLLLREAPRTHEKARVDDSSRSWKDLLDYLPYLAPLLLARVLVWVADGAVVIWIAPSLMRSFSLPADKAGLWVGGALLASGVVSPMLGGFLADRWQRTGGPRRTCLGLGVLALLSAPAALFGLAPTAAASIGLLTVFLILGYSLNLAAVALGTIVIPNRLRGLYMALSVSFAAIFGMGVAPLAVSLLSDALGGGRAIGPALSGVCLSTSAAAAAVFLLARRRFPTGVPS